MKLPNNGLECNVVVERRLRRGASLVELGIIGAGFGDTEGEPMGSEFCNLMPMRRHAMITMTVRIAPSKASDQIISNNVFPGSPLFSNLMMAFILSS